MTNQIITLTKTKPVVGGIYLVLDAQEVVHMAVVGKWPKGIKLISGTGCVVMDGPEDLQRDLKHLAELQPDKVAGVPLELVTVFQRYSRRRPGDGENIVHSVSQMLLDGNTFYKIGFEAVDSSIQLEPITLETATTGFHLKFINGLFEYVEIYKREGQAELNYYAPWYVTKQYAREDTIAQAMRFGGQFYKIPKLTK